MEDIKEKAEKLVLECEKHGFTAEIAIVDPKDSEEKGFVGCTGQLEASLANITTILMYIEDEGKIPLEKIFRIVRKAIKTYRREHSNEK